MTIRNIVCSALIFIPLFSCAQKPSHKRTRSSIDTLAFTWHYLSTEDDSCKNCDYTILDYPLFLNEPKLNDTLKQIMLPFLNLTDENKDYENIDTLFKQFAGGGKPLNDVDSTDSANSLTPMTNELHIKKLRETPNLITLELINDESGGVHPNESTTYINWDKKRHRNIILDDIFVKNYSSRLNNIGEKIFRQDGDLSKTASLAENGYNFDGDQFALNDNFAITDTGLHFYYNSYEIAPYMRGPTNVDIPFSKIKSLIKKNSIISQYIK